MIPGTARVQCSLREQTSGTGNARWLTAQVDLAVQVASGARWSQQDGRERPGGLEADFFVEGSGRVVVVVDVQGRDRCPRLR